MNPANLRRVYAEGLRQSANLQLEGVVEAFAVVPRELFLGEGQWQIVTRAWRGLPASPRGLLPAGVRARQVSVFFVRLV